MDSTKSVECIFAVSFHGNLPDYSQLIEKVEIPKLTHYYSQIVANNRFRK